MKKILISGALIALLSTSICFADTNIILNGSPVNFDESTGKPFVENNRTLVPMRAVLEQYGCTVNWEQSTKTATIIKNDTIVQVPIGASYIVVNGAHVVNDAPAQVIDGKTYLPIRAVLEAVGAEVTWDNESGSVLVNGDVLILGDEDFFADIYVNPEFNRSALNTSKYEKKYVNGFLYYNGRDYYNIDAMVYTTKKSESYYRSLPNSITYNGIYYVKYEETNDIFSERRPELKGGGNLVTQFPAFEKGDNVALWFGDPIIEHLD